MDHREYTQWLVLSLYEELDDDARTLLEEHLLTCAECRKDREELLSLHGILQAHRPQEIPVQLLQQARRERRVALSLRRENRPTLAEFFGILWAPKIRVAVGSALLVIAGFAAGWMVTRFTGDDASGAMNGFIRAGGAEAPFAPGAMRVQNVRLIRRDPATGEVEVEFDAVTPVNIRGNVNDERVQQVLARALVSDENTGMRLRALNMISGQTEARSDVDRQVKQALISALKFDGNLGVRKEALTVLQHYLPDRDVTSAILFVLANEKNTGMKIAAINALNVKSLNGPPASQEVLQALKNTVASDENNYIRIRAQAALKEAQQ